MSSLSGVIHFSRNLILFALTKHGVMMYLKLRFLQNLLNALRLSRLLIGQWVSLGWILGPICTRRMWGISYVTAEVRSQLYPQTLAISLSKIAS